MRMKISACDTARYALIKHGQKVQTRWHYRKVISTDRFIQQAGGGGWGFSASRWTFSIHSSQGSTIEVELFQAGATRDACLERRQGILRPIQIKVGGG